MKKPPTELDRVKAYIKATGPTEVARQTKLSRRALQYIINRPQKTPNYQTISAVLAAMDRQ